LNISANGASCTNNHSFDRAREGYLNLLVGGRLSSQTVPGDTPDSLAARRRFLSGGHYSPIARALSDLVGTPSGPLFDAGCGEGYYLSQMTAQHRYGLDVSKKAVQLASRLLPANQFVVASSYPTGRPLGHGHARFVSPHGNAPCSRQRSGLEVHATPHRA